MSKLTDDKAWEVYITCGDSVPTFARAIEALVLAQSQEMIKRLEEIHSTIYKRCSELHAALEAVASDILRNDDGVITDTLWHTGTETVIDFICNTLGVEVDELESQAHSKINKFCKVYNTPSASNTCEKCGSMTVQSPAQSAQASQDKVDAERYRFIRSTNPFFMATGRGHFLMGTFYEELDEKIDAAIKEQGNEPKQL